MAVRVDLNTGLLKNFVDLEILTFGPAKTGAGAFDGIDNPSAYHMVAEDSLATANDVRFLSVMAQEGQAITVDIDNTTLDTRLYVLDALGNIVAQNDNAAALDDGSTSLDDPHLIFTPGATGIYLFVVVGADNLYDGNFKFSGAGTETGSFQIDLSIATLPARTVLDGGDNLFFNSAATDHNVFGAGGNDTINLSGASNDIVEGGKGNDNLSLGSGNDVGHGGAGNDSLGGLGGNDVVYGGAGNDSVQGGTEDDQVFGGTGNDTLVGDTGDDILLGGNGDDILIPGLGDDIVDGGRGKDTLSFIFSPNGVTVDMRSGTVTAGPGSSVGGTVTGEGMDTFTGVEVINGSPNDDVLIGTAGKNEINGQNGNDTISGLGGDDKLHGDGDNDIVSGNNGDDLAFGDDGDDQVNGNDGNDALGGDAGDDVIKGGDGADNLSGGDGDDSLDGGTGPDVLTGGAGADKFVFHAGDSPPAEDDFDIDQIADFQQGIDVISIVGATHFVGTGSFHHQGDVGYFMDGNVTRITADLNGDGATDFSIRMDGKFTLHAADFGL
jgi:Ca2+-binding RTX toxin-like protein